MELAPKPCPTCKNLQNGEFEFNTGNLISGCESCSLLRKAIDTVYNFNWGDQLDVKVTVTADKPLMLVLPPPSSCYVLKHEFKRNRLKSREIQIFSGTEYGDTGSSPWPNIGPARTVPLDALAKESMELMKQWLDECLQSHDKCQLVESHKRKLPKRLLYVGDETSPPRLCISEDIPLVQYVALSHCWGEYLPLKTTMTTLAERQRCIQLQILPRTFSEALTVTRGLGFQYIWIDSLCIVQDSPEDWAEEASKMQDVYENAVFTISAAAAQDSTVGLSGPWRAAFQGKAIWGDRMYVSAAHCPSSLFITATRGSAAPLPRRAWALQENLLSRRILHFDMYETVWECRSEMACECLGSHGSSEQVAKDLELATRFFPDVIPGESDFAPFWARIIEEYSRRELTYSSDVLPAIAGVASRAAGGLHRTYLSGLWREHLPPLLLWYTWGGDKLARHAEYHCPTWSWASIIGEVVLQNMEDIDYDLKVHQAICEYRDEGSFMPPKSGILDIEGRAARVISKNGMWTVDSPWDDTIEDFSPDVGDWSEFEDVDDIKLLVVAKNRTLSHDAAEKDWYQRPMTVYGLIIRKSRKPNNSYERIGYGEYTIYDANLANLEFEEVFSMMRLVLV